MDSRTALERLDAVRPGSDDLSLPEMAGVGEVLASDRALAAEHRRRQTWERSIAVSMHDVPVPAGLKERLLATLVSQAVSAPVLPAKRHRRSALRLLAGIAACIAGIGIFWFVTANAPAPLTVAELGDAAAQLAVSKVQPEVFHGDFIPQFPSGNWRRLPVRPTIAGLFESGGSHRAAAWQFTFGHRGKSQGVLVVIPVEDVAAPPAEKREYVGGNTVAWTANGFVYVCRVEGPIDELLRQIDDARFA